jgi:hypothetical protein
MHIAKWTILGYIILIREKVVPMPENTYETIRALLSSNRADKLHQGLELIRQDIAREGIEAARPLFELLTEIFYVDPLEQPDLASVLDEAIGLAASFGTSIIPILIAKIDEGDMKAQLAIATALGRIGADAIAPLMAEYEASPDCDRQVFILYALGKIKSSSITRALPLVLEAAASPDREMRDTATRAIGKLAESIVPSDVDESTRAAMIDRLYQNLADTSPVIRAKAVRSLGKLARFGHMNPGDRARLKSVCENLLGLDKDFEWDRAYIVRYQAQEAMQYL